MASHPIGTATALAAVASGAAALVHAGAAGSHNGERALAVAFALTAAAQVGVASLVAAGRQRWQLGLLAAVNAGALCVWLYTRVDGISFVPGLEEAQDVGLADASAASFELLAAVAGGAAAARRRLVQRAPGARALVAMAVAGLLGAVPAMAAPHDHGEAAGHVATLDDHETGAGEHAATGVGAHTGEGSAAETVLGVSLPDVEGVTDAQRVAAATLVRDTRLAVAHFTDVAAAEAAGYRSIGDAITGFEHFVHPAYFADTTVLDPAHVESLVFQVGADGAKRLASAMYILAPGAGMGDVPDVAGRLTVWHDHQNLCWDQSGLRLAGIVVAGRCRPGGTFRPTPPMLHVWVTEHECGPFAGIEAGGHGGGCAAH